MPSQTAVEETQTSSITPPGIGRRARSQHQAAYIECVTRTIPPGFGERIFAMTERQHEHRRKLEMTTIEGARKRAWWGLWLGFVITIVVMISGTVAILLGHPWVGGGFMGVDVIALAGVFVRGQM
jgi:uncharacterized membrane protein